MECKRCGICINRLKNIWIQFVVPLIPITFDDQMKQLTSSSDFISILSMEIEKKFKGRIFLTPTFYYVNGDKKKVDSLQNWIMELKQAKFKYIYFLSSDHSWEKEEKNLTGSFLLIPVFSVEHLEMEQAHEVIKQQSQIIIDIFIDKWKNVDPLVSYFHIFRYFQILTLEKLLIYHGNS